MKWFKKKELRRDFGLVEFREELKAATHMALYRFLLDSRIAESQQLGTLLGLPILSEEDAAEEAAESQVRADRIAPMSPLIALFTSSMTTAVVEYLRTMTDNELTDAESMAMQELLERVTLSATLGSISQLEDLGLVRYTYGGSK